MLEAILAKLAMLAASMGAETASLWNNYQPIEPEKLKNR
ncbi:MAG: cyclic lactone autoinducer peptide [Clostridiales bacterium]|nr:cyclic lactone autoinducer peptide [Clostridiales bacterium]